MVVSCSAVVLRAQRSPGPAEQFPVSPPPIRSPNSTALRSQVRPGQAPLQHRGARFSINHNQVCAPINWECTTLLIFKILRGVYSQVTCPRSKWQHQLFIIFQTSLLRLSGGTPPPPHRPWEFFKGSGSSLVRMTWTSTQVFRKETIAVKCRYARSRTTYNVT